MRFRAWVCLLAVLLAVAMPAAAGAQAILAPAGPLFGPSRAVTLLGGADGGSAPDLFVPRRVPARAPPLA